jgi:YHS domain-containing protein
MKRNILFTTVGGTLAVAAVALAGGEYDHAKAKHEHDVGAKAACPISGNPVNLAVSVATDEGPVFFCCEGCISKFEADPSDYADDVAAQRKALADRPKIQVTCPVSGKPVDRKVHIDHKGRKVYFCCEGCIPQFEADPEEYERALANSYTYQTKCPVMGGQINPKAFTKLSGGDKIFYCCKGCDKKLFAEPQKYLPNLKAQGYRFTAEELSRQ